MSQMNLKLNVTQMGLRLFPRPHLPTKVTTETSFQHLLTRHHRSPSYSNLGLILAPPSSSLPLSTYHLRSLNVPTASYFPEWPLTFNPTHRACALLASLTSSNIWKPMLRLLCPAILPIFMILTGDACWTLLLECYPHSPHWPSP